MTEYIQMQPGPTDAELEAERDRKHAIEVAWWLEENKDLGMTVCDNPYCNHPPSDHANGRCTGEVTDFYGSWECLCVHYEKDPDE